MNNFKKRTVILGAGILFIIVCLAVAAWFVIPRLNPYSGRLAALYSDKQGGFSIRPPAGWKSVEIGNDKVPGIAFSPDQGVSSIRILSVPVPLGSTTPAASEVMASLEQQAAAQQHYAFVSDSPLKFKNYDAYQYEMTYGKGNVTQRSRIDVITKHGTVYIIFMTSPDSAWAKFHTVADASVDTFTFAQ